MKWAVECLDAKVHHHGSRFLFNCFKSRIPRQQSIVTRITKRCLIAAEPLEISPCAMAKWRPIPQRRESLSIKGGHARRLLTLNPRCSPPLFQLRETKMTHALSDPPPQEPRSIPPARDISVRFINSSLSASWTTECSQNTRSYILACSPLGCTTLVSANSEIDGLGRVEGDRCHDLRGPCGEVSWEPHMRTTKCYAPIMTKCSMGSKMGTY